MKKTIKTKKPLAAVIVVSVLSVMLFFSCTERYGATEQKETTEGNPIVKTDTKESVSEPPEDSFIEPDDTDYIENTFRVAFGFVDNCVLQRDTEVRIYGEGGNKGKTVTVTFGEQTKTGIVTADGWEVYLDPMPASSEGQTLTVEYGSVRRTFKNVVVGEVFLCSGQSNMAVSYNYILNKDKSVADDYHKYDNYSNLRFLNVYVRDKIEDYKRLHHYWLTYGTVEDGQDMSALALSFASNLSAMLGDEIPIGIIQCSVPGSSIEAWLDSESTDGLTHFSEGVSEWSCYYNAMLSGFDGYTVRALLWYQGETDSEPHMVSEYGEKFTRFLKTIRRDAGNEELPIITFQLVQYKWVPWQQIRQIQFDIAHTIKNVYMVCGIDTGCNIPDNPTAFAADGIHDTQKWLIGQRAAGLAVSELLKIDYSDLKVKTSYGNMPYLESAVRNGDKIIISVANSSSLTKSNGKLAYFEVFDGEKWSSANAVLDSNTVILECSGNVTSVRYLNDDVFPDGTAFIYNEYGNPVSPVTELSVSQ